MARSTSIEWADSTLNIWFGCTKVSAACDHCYAEAWSKRSALVKWGPGETRVQAKHWREELEAISRLAAKAGRPWFVFVNSLSDFFDNEADDALRAEALAAFRLHPRVTFILLTKRIGNAHGMLVRAGGLPPNCAAMITAIDQEEASRDIPKLLVLKQWHWPAFVGVSIEPQLGPIDLTDLDTMALRHCERIDALRGIGKDFLGVAARQLPRLDWVICGFESGPKSRPGHPEWARALRDQCDAAGVAFLFKQWGEWAACQSSDGEWPTDAHGHVRLDPDGSLSPSGWPMQKVGKKHAGRRLDGETYDARPGIPVTWAA